MGVDVDHSWHDHEAAPIDLGGVCAITRHAANCCDAIAGKGDVDIAPMGMALLGLVPGDDPGGVADDGRRGHGALLGGKTGFDGTINDAAILDDSEAGIVGNPASQFTRLGHVPDRKIGLLTHFDRAT